MSEHDEIVAFGYEVGHLARSPRAGWLLAGISDPESVAAHSHRTAVLAYIIAVMEGADPERACALAVFHDVPETRTMDLHSVAKRHVTEVNARKVIKEQTEKLPDTVAGPLVLLIDEVESLLTPESLCAKDADKLDCLLRALEYQMAGYAQVQPWVDSMATVFRTSSGALLGSRACEVPPSVWWSEVVSSYGK